jgi:hypothetical protein
VLGATDCKLKPIPPDVDGLGVTDTILPQTDTPATGRKSPHQLPPRGVIVGVVAALAVLAAGAGYELTKPHSAAPAPSARPFITPRPAATSTDSLLAKVMANALAQHTVHMLNKTVSPKHGVAIFSDDDGVTSGVQRISIFGGHVDVRVVGPATYFTGDQVGMTKYMGFSASQAEQVHGQWLSLVAGQPGYESVTAGVTLASALNELGLADPLRQLPPRTRHGQRVFGIQGKPTGDGTDHSARATLWITAGRPSLPVEYDVTTAGSTATIRLSHWGRAVNVQAPLRLFTPGGVAG